MVHWHGRCIGGYRGRDLKLLRNQELVQGFCWGLLLQIVQCCPHWKQITGFFDRFYLWSLISTLTKLIAVVLGLFLSTVHWLRLHMINMDRRNTQGWRERRRGGPWGSPEIEIEYLWQDLMKEKYLRILKSRDESTLL